MQPKIDGNPTAEDKEAEMTEIAESNSESGGEDSSIMEVEDVDAIDESLSSVETGLGVGYNRREDVPTTRQEIAVGMAAPRLENGDIPQTDVMPPPAKPGIRTLEQAPEVEAASEAQQPCVALVPVPMAAAVPGKS